jgi:NAD(P)-dependent dehydrogenase (short-subunit alcohol dehydrogenase family)
MTLSNGGDRRILSGKNALVVGGSVGIGRAVCEAFAYEGANVCIADRGDAQRREALAVEIRKYGIHAMHVEVDVTQEQTLVAAIDATIASFGHIDILVNNAGITSQGSPIQAQNWDTWDDIFNVNLKGVAYGLKHVIPHMLSRGSGRIINTSSQLAHRPISNHSAYCASKAAVTSLTASVAQEVARHGITVNCVCPGMTNTDMLFVGGAAFVEEKLKTLPIGRPGDPREVASAFVYLASDAAAFFIGQSLSPNGGDVMW